jgi:hypothetical protein
VPFNNTSTNSAVVYICPRLATKVCTGFCWSLTCAGVLQGMRKFAYMPMVPLVLFVSACLRSNLIAHDVGGKPEHYVQPIPSQHSTHGHLVYRYHNPMRTRLVLWWLHNDWYTNAPSVISRESMPAQTRVVTDPRTMLRSVAAIRYAIIHKQTLLNVATTTIPEFWIMLFALLALLLVTTWQHDAFQPLIWCSGESSHSASCR